MQTPGRIEWETESTTKALLRNKAKQPITDEAILKNQQQSMHEHPKSNERKFINPSY